MHLLRAIIFEEMPPGRAVVFPFNIPALQNVPEIRLDTLVTFLVGENGMGKSTLLGAIASAANLIADGSEDIAADVSLATVRQLSRSLRLPWRRKTRQGFFLRAEDFFGYAKRLSYMRQELEHVNLTRSFLNDPQQ